MCLLLLPLFLRFHVPQLHLVGGVRSFPFLIPPPLLSSMVLYCCRRAAFHEFVPIVFYIDHTFHDLPFSRTPLDPFHLLPLGLRRHHVQQGSVDDGSISPPPLITFDSLVDDGSLSPSPLILLEDTAE
jgi:hypothetical protein